MSERLTAWVFPGQGAQFPGMGRGLFDEFPEHVELASHVLGYSLKELCLEPDGDRLNRTEFTQPALYVVNVLHYLKALREGIAGPHYLAGHSLGEYCALFAAGAFDFETGLQLVKRRGELMGRAGGGGMAAISNHSPESLDRLLKRHALSGLEIAVFNSPAQLVVAGPNAELDALTKIAADEGSQFFRLPVSAAFHSRHMQSAMLAFAPFLRGFSFNALGTTVISNFRARPYAPDQVRDNLVFQIRHPVRWLESVWYLMVQGVSDFVEVGPRKTLAKMLAQIREAPVPDWFAASLQAN